MAKKKVEEATLSKPTMKVEDYWRWRNCITEMWLEDKKLEIAKRDAQLLESKMVADSLKLSLMKVTKIKHCESEVQSAKQRYDNLKSSLEGVLGVSLSGKAINEFTLEVVELPEGE